ncbi:PAS domain S-box protein [Sporomusa aerivorans]|uniref:PAS domain S-box protein n=1 Tax=Sporomusa aerivorans TaxID=204936 RepID=UPI00352AF5C7
MELEDKLFLIEEINKLRQRVHLLEQENAGLRRALSESDEKLSTLVSAAPDLICFKDKNGRWIETNAFTLNLFGLHNCEYKGKTDSELVNVCKNYPDLLNLCISTDRLAWQKGETIRVEEEVVRQDGRAITFDVIKVPIYYPDGSPKALIVMGRDVSSLKENEKRLRLILENAPVMMLAVDETGQIVAWNKECERVTGFTYDEIVNNRQAYLMLFPDPVYWEYIIQLFVSRGAGFRDLEITLNCRDGSKKVISWFSISDRFPVTGWKLWTFGVDITARKQMEEMLERQQKEFKSLAENSPDVIIRFDKNFNYLYINQVITRYTDIEPTMYIGKSLGEMALNADSATTARIWENAVASVIKTKKTVTIESKLKLQPFANQLIFYHARFIPEFTDNGTVESVLCIIQDTTEKKILERELGRLERLNVVGEMAASIGHEVRNPMTTVRGFLQMLTKKTDCRQYAEYFAIMIEELDRANAIISEFLALAKNKAIHRELCNLNEIINNMVPLLEADGLMANRYIKTCLADIPALLIDQKEIRQLLLNLVRNGMEATQAGGTVTIRTYFEENDIVLAVKDEGYGITPEIVDKIGTPFFTTKEQGTGLGLAVCYSIAQRHNAMIKYDTSPAGTTFFVAFHAAGQDCFT